MKCATVNSKDVFDPKKNPTLCLSAKRYTDGCTSCKIFNDAFYKMIQISKTDEEIAASGGVFPLDYRYVKIRLTVHEAFKRLKCGYIISKSQLDLLHKRDSIFEKKDAIQQELDRIQETLGVKP